MNLRNYQEDCITSTMAGMHEWKKQLIVMPTGSGKTIVFSSLAQRMLNQFKTKTLILAHREELIDQAVDKIRSSTGIQAEVEKAERQASLYAPIVVGSVQTLQRDRLLRWPQDHFGMVVCDEAHHVLADSWKNTLGRFDANAQVIGVTATPGRGDKRNLGQYFENIAYEISLLKLIKEKFLSPIVIRTVPLEIELSNVSSIGGDYDSNGLSDAITPVLQGVIDSIKKFALERKILVFLPLIKTSKQFVELCKNNGLSALHVDGEMDERKETLNAFRDGKAQILSNAMLLLEGYDEPSIDCVIMLRPTRSKSLYAQAVGRGTRICEGKKDLLLLDFLWLHEKHNLAQPVDLIAEDEKQAEVMKKKAKKGGQMSLTDLQDEAISEFESSLAKEVQLHKNKSGRIISIEEVAVALHAPDLARFEGTMRWHSSPPTQKQLDILKQNHIPAESVKNKGHASFLLDRIFNRRTKDLASLSQVVWLKRMGHPNPQECSFSEAKSFLAAKFGKK